VTVDWFCELQKSDSLSRFQGLGFARAVQYCPLCSIADQLGSFFRYPIYRIPTGPTLRDLAACFLTYHSLSTPMNGTSGVWMNTASHFQPIH
jgi:hypothetical protein